MLRTAVFFVLLAASISARADEECHPPGSPLRPFEGSETRRVCRGGLCAVGWQGVSMPSGYSLDCLVIVDRADRVLSSAPLEIGHGDPAPFFVGDRVVEVWRNAHGLVRERFSVDNAGILSQPVKPRRRDPRVPAWPRCHVSSGTCVPVGEPPAAASSSAARLCESTRAPMVTCSEKGCLFTFTELDGGSPSCLAWVPSVGPAVRIPAVFDDILDLTVGGGTLCFAGDPGSRGVMLPACLIPATIPVMRLTDLRDPSVLHVLRTPKASFERVDARTSWHVRFGLQSWRGAEDVSAVLHAGHDGRSLIVIAEVTDDHVITQAARAIAADHLELSIAPLHDGTPERLGLLLDASGSVTGRRWKRGSADVDEPVAVRGSWTRTKHGYRVEASIALAELGMNAPSQHRAELLVSDGDDGKRQSVLMGFSGALLLWSDPVPTADEFSRQQNLEGLLGLMR